MKFLLLLLISSNCYALAPPPVNFQYEEIETPQGTIVVKFDGHKMTATMKKRTPLYKHIFIVFGFMFYTSLAIFIASIYYGYLKPLVLFYIVTWVAVLICVIAKRLTGYK